MGVPNITTYSAATFQLGNLTETLKDTNRVISTGKRINEMSDDPVGMTQVLNLRSSLDNLEQIEKNVAMGKSWLDGSETALQEVQNQILEAKTLTSQLVNASASATERADAVQVIEGIIDQVLSLGNKQVNGNFIFSGTKNNVTPFTYDDREHPTRVDYNGNATPFAIKSGFSSRLDVGEDGDKVFTEDTITVDGTNNMVIFREDPGLGQNAKETLEGKIPDGKYTPDELAVAVRNAMNRASKEDGYEVNYQVTYDEAAKTFRITDDGKYDGFFRFDMLWESGEEPRISGINTDGTIQEGVDISIVNDDALVHETPEPSGTAPLRFTWDGEGNWKVLNDPGYGLPLQVAGTDQSLELDLSGDGLTDILITSEAPVEDGGFIEFDIVAESDEHSIGPDMGFRSGDVSSIPPESDNEVVLKTFDHTNNVIDFQEDAGSGFGAVLSAAVPARAYTDMSELAAAIEEAMEDASENNIDYSVDYSSQTRRFAIEDENGSLTGLSLLWNTGPNSALSAAGELGYDNTADDTGALAYTGDNDVVLFDIALDTNDTINFREIPVSGTTENCCELTARIPAGQYTDPDSLAAAVEAAMESVSKEKGNGVDYEVTYSNISRKFTIKEDGDYTEKKLDDFDLLWGTGADINMSAGDVMGFDQKNTSLKTPESEPVRWGLFETLFDLKDYLSKNDVDGLSRTMTRLDTHYNSITSEISDIGMKYNRLEIREQVTTETATSYKERKSRIEEADIVEAIMNLQSAQTAYQASLSSTSRILNISLVDYM